MTAKGDQVALATNTTTLKQHTVKQKRASPGYPVRIKIPKINIDASLEYVALTSDGALGAPKSPEKAGWYVRGPRPGEKGSAVIDGHFGFKDNLPAVFDNLHKLNPGDKIYTKDDRGSTTAFIVRALREYGQNENASKVFDSNDGKAHLNLITCQGTWDYSQKSFSNRLVVFADKQ